MLTGKLESGELRSRSRPHLRLRGVLAFLIAASILVHVTPARAEENDLVRKLLSEFSLAKPSPGIPDYLNNFESQPNAKKNKRGKNVFRALVETLGVDVGTWLYDKVIIQVNWANITLHSIESNFRRGYSWTQDSFKCDNFDHPWAGANDFVAGRDNGLSYYESIILPLLGTVIWEYAGENTRPSTIDTVNTFSGGITWGEILYRVGNDLLIRQNATGLERIVRETATFILLPIVGFNRLITGRAFQVDPAPQEHSYDLQVPIGIFGSGLMTEVDINYLDAWEKHELHPYDYFAFKARIDSSQKIISGAEISTSGLIFGKVINNSSERRELFGLFGEYNYLDFPRNSIGKLSAFGFGPGWTANFHLNPKLYLNVSAVLAGIVGGTTSSFALTYGEHFFDAYVTSYRFDLHGGCWHFGPGALGQLDLEFGKTGWGSIATQFSQYWIHSIYLPTDEFLSELTIDGNVDLSQRIRLNAGVNTYWRNATFKGLWVREATPLLHSAVVFKF
jgi:hypothetical protein